MKTTRPGWQALWATLLVATAGFNAAAQSTNPTAVANSAPADSSRAESAASGFDEASFRIVSERNIFNANRSGGTVRLTSRRPAQVETFTLVGTMAYEKGAFAFFEGSSSELTKALKPDGIIAGHKLVDIYTDSVKLEADGKHIELPIGSQMRREDQGTWQVTEAAGGGYSVASGSNTSNAESSSRSSRSDRSRSGDSSSRSRRGSDSNSSRRDSSETRSAPAASPAASNLNESEVLKRLRERREKESP